MTIDRSTLDVTALLPTVVDLARTAGLRIMAIYATAFTVTQKVDDSPLTAADMASHEVITQGLSQLTPTIPILSEESATIAAADRIQWETFWLVDPLDGTKEFVDRNGEFTVNIALVHHHQPILGVVHVPVSGLSYFAAQGAGAWRRSLNEAPQAIHAAQLTDAPIRVIGSRSHGSKALEAFVARLPRQASFVRVGSALKFCWIAEGRADVYPRFGPTSEWDTAAAHCIAEQAGATVVDVTGAPLRYNTRVSLLNPHFLVFGDTGFDWLQYVPHPVS